VSVPLQNSPSSQDAVLFTNWHAPFTHESVVHPLLSLHTLMTVKVTSALEDAHGGLLIVQRTTIGPDPLVCVNVALGVVLLGLKVPVPPLNTDQLPVPLDGVLPPRPDDVPPLQMLCDPPTVAAVGGAFTVIVTFAVDAVHGELEIVQRSTTLPAPPPVWVKVALGVVLFGPKVPVNPPVTIDQAPVPVVGVFPPRPAVVPFVQMVCGPPTVAVVGAAFAVIVTSAVDAVHGELEIVHRRTKFPAPPPV